jgi:hypothetical protein
MPDQDAPDGAALAFRRRSIFVPVDGIGRRAPAELGTAAELERRRRPRLGVLPSAVSTADTGSGASDHAAEPTP